MKNSRSLENLNNQETDWLYGISLALVIGLGIVAVLGLANEGFGRVAALMSGLLLSFAAGLIGAFLGFLFGIPRSKQMPVQMNEDGSSFGRAYNENTNLEQISDWLTKIIVGLSLVQYHAIRDQLVVVGGKFAPVFAAADQGVTGAAVAIAVILYFMILGFLFTYLWTRIFMEGVLQRQNVLTSLALDEARRDAEAEIKSRVRQEFDQNSREIEEVLRIERAEKSDADAHAFKLTDAYLDPRSNPEAEEFDDLPDAIAKASLTARTLIFKKAQRVRRENWRPSGNRALVDRTIPVFRGLIQAEPNNYHRNYGQLGYALANATTPDWAGAETALRRALQMRGDDRAGQGYYEFVLAVALINQDAGYATGTASTADQTARITTLLRKGAEAIDPATNPDISEWARLNGIALEEYSTLSQP